MLLESSRFILSGSVDEVRGFLFTMATTCLATAGVVFTLLTLPLSTVAAQYGSRLLRIFLGDRVTQFVLGMFVGTFVYCIAAALVIPPVELEPQPPQLLATVGFLLFLGTFAALILLDPAYLHHAPGAQYRGSSGLGAAGRGRFGYRGGVRLGNPATDLCGIFRSSLLETAGHPVRVAASGYIKYIDPGRILALARDRDLVIRLLLKPGHFVGARRRRCDWSGPPSGSMRGRRGRSRDAFHLGKQRTPTQDVEYAVNQLAEMAVRAMSPAINDPFTAMTCLDYMGDGLAVFVRERKECSYIFDRDGRLRIVFDPGHLRPAARCRLRYAPPCQQQQREGPAAHAGRHRGDRPGDELGRGAPGPSLVTSLSSRRRAGPGT